MMLRNGEVLLPLIAVVVGLLPCSQAKSLQGKVGRVIPGGTSPPMIELVEIATNVSTTNKDELLPVPKLPPPMFIESFPFNASTIDPGSDLYEAPVTSANFEGLSNDDNERLLGVRIVPPDPVGAVGPNHYVQMINSAWAVFDKRTGAKLLDAQLAMIFQGLDVCNTNDGDPIGTSC